MQKLEEVLRAEEQARHAEAGARDASAARIRDAEAEARHIVASARDDAATQADRLRQENLALAAERAAEIGAAYAATLESTDARGRERITAAAQAALEELLS